jgi:hypothetical protein
MEGDLRRDAWVAVNSLGGTWSWDFDGTAGTAAIVASGITAPTSQLVEIDARIDDGDLSGGLLRASGNQFIYYLQR